MRQETRDHADGPPHLPGPHPEQIAEILDDYRGGRDRQHPRPRWRPAADPADARPSDYTYATDLIDDVDAANHFSIGVAAHPEVHPRSPDRDADRRHLAAKLRRADFAITQFFFETEHYVRLVDELAALGVDKPVLPGIMPVTNTGPILRMAAMNGDDGAGRGCVDRLDGGRRPGRGPPHRRRRGHRPCAPSCSRPARRGCTSTRSTAAPRPGRSTPTSGCPPATHD